MTDPVPADGPLHGYLSALQLADSAFPSGRYTLSYGLEAVAESGRVRGRDASETLTTLLGDSLRSAVGPSDGVALACAHRAVGPGGTVDWEVVSRADRRLTAVKLVRETREASIRTGRALLSTAGAATAHPAILTLAQRVHDARSPGNHAVALGLVSAVLGVPRLTAVAGELFSYSSGWASAAVRLGLIDHRGAQRLLHRVRPVTAAVAQIAVDRGVEDIAGCAPFLDVMSMRHEQTDVRLFST